MCEQSPEEPLGIISILPKPVCVGKAPLSFAHIQLLTHRRLTCAPWGKPKEVCLKMGYSPGAT